MLLEPRDLPAAERAPRPAPPVERNAGPPRGHHRAETEQAPVVAPGGQFPQTVGADDEPEFRPPAVEVPQLLDRLHRVRDPPAAQLDVGGAESRVARRRELDHAQPVPPAREPGGVLVRRDVARDEQHPVRPERLPRPLGDDQVPEMDRVERAAHDPDPGRLPRPVSPAPHGRHDQSLTCPAPRTTYL